MLAKTARSKALLSAAIASLISTMSAQAADQIWTNGGGDSQWNTTSINWGSVAWNNGPFNGAVFDLTGIATISVTEPINTNSLDFRIDGYALTGSSTINIGAGSSTLGNGIIKVAPGLPTYISAPISSTGGLLKTGAGTLVLSGPFSNTGGGINLTLTPGVL